MTTRSPCSTRSPIRAPRAHAFRVGATFPLRPPLGAAVVAWASDAVRDDWLAHVPADTRAHYADALVATHDRGFAVEIAATPVARVRELAGMLGDDPSARAALDRLADELATHEEFLAVDLDAGPRATRSTS